MSDLLLERLQHLLSSGAVNFLGDSLRGMEKESLRVDTGGYLSKQRHPHALGAALTHPNITTDFSEAQLELITPTFKTIPQALSHLAESHRFVYSNIGDELLWVSSMPCILNGDASIPLAEYGSSHQGSLKHLYRKGLSLRYGRLMQAISGIHYNYSFSSEFWENYLGVSTSAPAFRALKDDAYLGLIRNFLRYSWWLVLVTGASPALCRSFMEGKQSSLLRTLNKKTLYGPFATSLRMGDLGYQSSEQESLHVCYNSLSTYVSTLRAAMNTPSSKFTAIGTYKKLPSGLVEYLQISDKILQIENEFYGSIRPKRTPDSGQLPTDALIKGGVQYVEVRLLDLDPFEPLGIGADRLKVVEDFLLFCLLMPSPALGQDELLICRQRVKAVVEQGRDHKALLPCLPTDEVLCKASNPIGLESKGVPLGVQAVRLAEQLEEISKSVRKADGRDGNYYSVIKDQLKGSLELPSGRVVRALKEQNLSFFEFSMQCSRQAKESILSVPMSDERKRQLIDIAAQSHQSSADLEAASSGDFGQYIADFLKGYDM